MSVGLCWPACALSASLVMRASHGAGQGMRCHAGASLSLPVRCAVLRECARTVCSFPSLDVMQGQTGAAGTLF